MPIIALKRPEKRSESLQFTPASDGQQKLSARDPAPMCHRECGQAPGHRAVPFSGPCLLRQGAPHTKTLAPAQSF